MRTYGTKQRPYRLSLSLRLRRLCNGYSLSDWPYFAIQLFLNNTSAARAIWRLENCFFLSFQS